MSVEIICDDALNWLKKQKNNTVGNFLTGICDLDEMGGISMEKYLNFLNKVVNLIFEKLHDDGYAIFIQTDRKYNRSWIDKSYLISKIAHTHGLKMIWHKIVLHRSVNATDTYRPTYAHMLCYSKNGTTGSATPDVIDVSKKLYKNGTPIVAGYKAVEFINQYSKNKLIVDPFVGRGVITGLARLFGIPSIGIDISSSQCELAKDFEFSPADLKEFKHQTLGNRSKSKKSRSRSRSRS